MGFTVGSGRAVFWFCGASSSGFSKVGSTVGVLGAVFGSMGRAFPADSGVGSTEEASLGMPAPAFCGSKQDSDDSTVGSGVGSVDWACGARAQPMISSIIISVSGTILLISNPPYSQYWIIPSTRYIYNELLAWVAEYPRCASLNERCSISKKRSRVRGASSQCVER